MSEDLTGDRERCSSHRWSYGGNSGIDLCTRCPAVRAGGRTEYTQSGPPFGYDGPRSIPHDPPSEREGPPSNRERRGVVKRFLSRVNRLVRHDKGGDDT